MPYTPAVENPSVLLYLVVKVILIHHKTVVNENRFFMLFMGFASFRL
jgi:hypothetical protein